MPSSLLSAVGIPTHKQLTAQRQTRRQNHQPSYGIQIQRVPILQNRRQEEFDSIVGGRAAKVRGGQGYYLPIAEGFHKCHPPALGSSHSLEFQLGFKRLAFVFP